MRLGKTYRKIVCRKCTRHIGWIKDLVVESDLDGGVLAPFYCKECYQKKYIDNDL